MEDPMRLLIAALAFIVLTVSAYADQYVHGYTRSNGTYVAPYMRSSPDSITSNNWSTKGNVNPYTGAPGTRNADSSYGSSYGSSSYGSSNSNSNNSLYGNGGDDDQD
jgi:hypothetical protein